MNPCFPSSCAHEQSSLSLKRVPLHVNGSLSTPSPNVWNLVEDLCFAGYKSVTFFLFFYFLLYQLMIWITLSNRQLLGNSLLGKSVNPCIKPVYDCLSLCISSATHFTMQKPWIVFSPTRCPHPNTWLQYMPKTANSGWIDPVPVVFIQQGLHGFSLNPLQRPVCYGSP